MWKRKRKAEWLPWYRAHDYTGNLTEKEKRLLDAFRAQPTHPSANFEQLPEEVQRYVNRIEMELYDQKQEAAAGRAIVLSEVGAALLFSITKASSALQRSGRTEVVYCFYCCRGLSIVASGTRTLRHFFPRIIRTM